MAIFRDLSKRRTDASDRSTKDRARHRQLVKDALKKTLPDIISEEEIIGASGSKKIKVPIRSVREWRFIYSDRQPGIGQGQGQNPGDIIGDGDQPGGGRPQPGVGGNEPGEMMLETELTLDEILDILFEDLSLPFLEQKKLHELELKRQYKWQGTRQKGIEPRMDLESSFIEKLKRKKILEAELEKAETENPEKAEQLRQELAKTHFPFREEDLRYHSVTTDIEEESNAVIFAIRDSSGSMDITKRYLAQAFLLFQHRFIKTKFRRADMVFIGHHTEAFETTEWEFFHLAESGGTNISSGPRKALEIIKLRYPTDLWNIYATHCSDGENFPEDNNRAIQSYQELVDIANLVGFVEIKPTSGAHWSTIGSILKDAIKSPHFQLLHIQEKNQVWPTFRDFMNCDKKYREGK